MEKSKKRLLTLGIVGGVIFVIALTIVLLFIPYKITMLDGDLGKVVKSDITSITVQMSPCCGPMEGPRRTYTKSSEEFITEFKNVVKKSSANREIALRAGGQDILLTIKTTSGTFEVNFDQGKIVTKTGKYHVRDWESWAFLYDFPEDTLIEEDY